MIRRETYEWMEPILEEAEREGARVISVSHHNLLDESGVSRTFYDNCTIEHNEELVRMLSDHGVRLHLSGHLHIQHYKEDEDTGIYEVVTGSMVMAPCHYGIVRIWNDGTYQYDAKPVDVDGWAIRHSYHNRDLADFTAYSESILRRAAIRDAIRDLNRHIEDRHAFFTDEKKQEMASYYADLCVNYYEGRMYQIEEAAKENPVLEDWNKIGYVSELSDFLQNILEDEAKDYGHLKIPSVH
ncbi:MAG: metallophosphoesterase [Clostridium fessum]